MIIIGKNTIKHTHTHTERYFVYCIYTLSSIVVVVVVVFLWIFRRFSLVAFACCTAHVHCFHETATALATGHGPRKRITGQMAAETEFSRLSPLSVNLTRSLSPLCTLPYALISPQSLSLSVNDRASDPYKILNKHTTFLYAHIYVYRDYIRPDTSHIFVKNTYDKRQHRHWEYLAKGWGLGVGGTLGTLCESHNRFAFHWQIFLSTVFYSCFEKIHKNTFACRIKKEQQ